MINQLTEEQSKACEELETGKNIFLSGYSGTGKSFLLKYFTEEMTERDKGVIVASTTGTGAIDIEGTTLRRLLGIKKSPMEELVPIKTSELLALADILIIDKIEHCSEDELELVVKAIKAANTVRKAQNKSKLQLIVSGDFCELYPGRDKSEFLFQKKIWKDCGFTNLFLKKNVRQTGAFARAINKIQLGDASGINYINTHSAKKPKREAITLLGSKDNDANRVSTTNNQTTLNLKAKSVVFRAQEDESLDWDEHPNASELLLKEGTKVVFIKDAPNKTYRKGNIGIIEDIVYDENDNTPIGVNIRLKNGSLVYADYYNWDIYSYTIERIGIANTPYIAKNSVGYFMQLPIVPAYVAHAGTGLPYDAVTLNPESLTTNELYSVLSNIKKLSDLYLEKPITPSMIQIDDKLKAFYLKLKKSRKPRVLKSAAESPSQHKKVEKKPKKSKNTTSTSHKGGHRNGAGRKQSVPGMKSSAIRIPEILADPLKEIKALGADDVYKVAELLNDFVQNHKNDNE